MPINLSGNELTSLGVKLLNETNIPTSSLSYYYDASLTSTYPGSGTTVSDFMGNIGGVLQNGASYSTSVGGNFAFDGSNDRLLLNSSINLGNGSVNWTVYTWMRTTSTADSLTGNPILSNTNGGPIHGSLDVDGGKQTYWAYPSNINDWKQFKGTVTVNDGNWRMLTWVNNSDLTMGMFVDGIFDTTVSPTNVSQNPLDVIGGGLGTSFNGNIGLVAVYYNTAHSISQVLQFFNSTRQRFRV
jgi:hypothetical protein